MANVNHSIMETVSECICQLCSNFTGLYLWQILPVQDPWPEVCDTAVISADRATRREIRVVEVNGLGAVLNSVSGALRQTKWEELKVLYTQYWPKNADAMHGETEVASLSVPWQVLSYRPTDSTKLRRKRHPLGTEGAMCCCDYHSFLLQGLSVNVDIN